jgi:hypothetical protein
MTENKEISLSYLGECYVPLELGKLGLKVAKVHDVSFDFLAKNGAKIEVKSALPSRNRTYKEKIGKTYEYKNWQFRITTEEQQQSDFFICIVFENVGIAPIGYFIFPNKAIKTLGKSNIISVFESDIQGDFKKVNKEDKNQYFNNWNLILDFNKDSSN